MSQLMKYKGYHTAVIYDSDDNVLKGKIIGISDIVAFNADSIKEFREIFERSVDNYLDYCISNGKKPEEVQKKKTIKHKTMSEEARGLKEYYDSHDISIVKDPITGKLIAEVKKKED